jgi:hypothetical protein
VVVAPAWAWTQTKKGIEEPKEPGAEVLIEKLEKTHFSLPGEKIPDYVKRKDLRPSLPKPDAA